MGNQQAGGAVRPRNEYQRQRMLEQRDNVSTDFVPSASSISTPSTSMIKIHPPVQKQMTMPIPTIKTEDHVDKAKARRQSEGANKVSSVLLNKSMSLNAIH